MWITPYSTCKEAAHTLSAESNLFKGLSSPHITSSHLNSWIKPKYYFLQLGTISIMSLKIEGLENCTLRFFFWKNYYLFIYCGADRWPRHLRDNQAISKVLTKWIRGKLKLQEDEFIPIKLNCPKLTRKRTQLVSSLRRRFFPLIQVERLMICLHMQMSQNNSLGLFFK